MAKYKIECVVEVPDAVSDDDVYEWARFELNENGHLDSGNPLSNAALEAVFPSVSVERQ